MHKKVSVAELLVTLLVFAVGCAGIGLTAVNRTDKTSGTLSLENYERYLTADCSVGGSGFGYGNVWEFEYTVKIRPLQGFRLKNVVITYSLYAENTDLSGSYTERIDACGYGDPYMRTGKIKIYSEGTLSEVGAPSVAPVLTVTAVSGSYGFEW